MTGDREVCRPASRRCLFEEEADLMSVLGGPGGDLLSRVLRQSTIGAEAFDGRVRDGIGSYRLAEGHQAGEKQKSEVRNRKSEGLRASGFRLKQN
jgi:hypothetical protein